MFGLRYLTGVTTLALDESQCNGCGVCVAVCPQAVFTMHDRKARIVDRDACMECGACARNCARGAVTVHSGVGCLEAIIRGALAGTEPTCDCAKDRACCG